MELNLCFILSAAVIGLPRHLMNMLRIDPKTLDGEL